MDKKNQNKTFKGQAFEIINQFSMVTGNIFGQTK